MDKEENDNRNKNKMMLDSNYGFATGIRLAQVGYIKLFIICIFLSFLICHLYLLF